MEPEKRALYDQQRQLIGTILKGEPTPEDTYIVVVLVWMQNSQGEFLIQKRSVEKNGLYATTGGHPKLGESSIEGMVTEIREELSLEIPPEKLQLYCVGRSDPGRVFFDDYYLKIDIPDLSNLKLDPREVESVSWMTADEIHQLAKDQKFFKSHYEEFDILLEWLQSNDKTTREVVHG